MRSLNLIETTKFFETKFSRLLNLNLFNCLLIVLVFKETTNPAVSEIGESSRTQKTPENSSPQSIEETLKSSLIKLRRVINKEVYQVHCIGFLISKKYAYSAAHCLVLDRFINDFAYMRQQINTLRVETLPNVSRGLRGFMYKVQFFLVHSHFKGNKAIGYTADFGIIKVSFFMMNIVKLCGNI